ncbi:MAG: hypothetical protein NTW87_21300 [Planctomycetota bacterium]|nr:hypothetical protein [Planctomycetota bacterium]
MMGGGGGIQNIFGMASRMLGMDIEDPKAGPKLDALPLGADKRFIFNVPVGGVDNPGGQASGWKMEAVFKMTDEQTAAVETLRAEYALEQKKLEQKIQAQYKVLADELKALRLKYEQRANDALTGDDKGRKEKMDALARDTNAKNADIVKDLLPLYDTNDFQQRMALSRAMREKANKNAEAAEGKLLELVPPDNREKMEAVIKQQAEARANVGRMGNFNFGGAGGRGVQGGGAGGGHDPVKPPRPPEADKKADF